MAAPSLAFKALPWVINHLIRRINYLYVKWPNLKHRLLKVYPPRAASSPRRGPARPRFLNPYLRTKTHYLCTHARRPQSEVPRRRTHMHGLSGESPLIELAAQLRGPLSAVFDPKWTTEGGTSAEAVGGKRLTLHISAVTTTPLGAVCRFSSAASLSTPGSKKLRNITFLYLSFPVHSLFPNLTPQLFLNPNALPLFKEGGLAIFWIYF